MAKDEKCLKDHLSGISNIISRVHSFPYRWLCNKTSFFQSRAYLEEIIGGNYISSNQLNSHLIPILHNFLALYGKENAPKT